MTALTPIRLEPQGPAGRDLEVLETINPALLSAGEPVQRGHVYYTDPTGTLTAGVWDCTPMTMPLRPYHVNEFILMLEGSLTMVDTAGREERFTPGQAFMIPKGLPISWVQTEYVRKFYVVFDDPSGDVLPGLDASNVTRIDPNRELAPVGEQDTARYLGGVPEQHVHGYFEDATGQMGLGVWDTTAMHTRPEPFGRSELMHILEGTVTLAGGTPGEQTLKAGDTCMVPKGLPDYKWDSEGYVRKIYCTFEPR